MANKNFEILTTEGHIDKMLDKGNFVSFIINGTPYNCFAKDKIPEVNKGDYVSIDFQEKDVGTKTYRNILKINPADSGGVTKTKNAQGDDEYDVSSAVKNDGKQKTLSDIQKEVKSKTYNSYKNKSPEQLKLERDTYDLGMAKNAAAQFVAQQIMVKDKMSNEIIVANYENFVEVIFETNKKLTEKHLKND